MKLQCEVIARDVVFTNEVQAVSRAIGGDPQAFEYLYRQYKGQIYRLCLRMIHDPARAEDFTQDTFLQGFRHIATFRGASKFSTWLSRIAINLVLVNMRQTKRRPEISINSFEDPQEDLSASRKLEWFPGLTSNSVDWIHLERAIATLPPDYKRMFILHHVEGYPSKEIAKMFGFTVSNIKTQLHRARTRLRNQLLQPKKPWKRAATRTEPALALYAGRCAHPR